MSLGTPNVSASHALFIMSAKCRIAIGSSCVTARHSYWDVQTSWVARMQRCGCGGLNRNAVQEEKSAEGNRTLVKADPSCA